MSTRCLIVTVYLLVVFVSLNECWNLERRIGRIQSNVDSADNDTAMVTSSDSNTMTWGSSTGLLGGGGSASGRVHTGGASGDHSTEQQRDPGNSDMADSWDDDTSRYGTMSGSSNTGTNSDSDSDSDSVSDENDDSRPSITDEEVLLKLIKKSKRSLKKLAEVVEKLSCPSNKEDNLDILNKAKKALRKLATALEDQDCE